MITCSVVKLLKPTSTHSLTHNSVLGNSPLLIKTLRALYILKAESTSNYLNLQGYTYSSCKYSGVYYDSTDLTSHLYIYPDILTFNIYIYITEHAHNIIDRITWSANMHTKNCTHHAILNFVKTLFYTKSNFSLSTIFKKCKENFRNLYK